MDGEKQMLFRTKRVVWARLVVCWRAISGQEITVTTVGTSPLCVPAGDAKGLHECLHFQRDFVFSRTKAIGEDLSCVVISRMPQPPLLAFAAHHTLPLTHLGCFHVADDDLPLRSIHMLEQSFIDVLSACMARLVEVIAICHHEAAAVHQASAVAMSCLAEQTLALERTLRQVVCRITMGTPPTPSEVRSTSGPQAGGDGLRLLTDSVRREGRHCQKGVVHTL
jgi:hypothetical protein